MALTSKIKRIGPPLALIAPSVILIGIFVYALIIANFRTSLTDIHTAAQTTGKAPHEIVWFANYVNLFSSEAFQHSLKNLVLYTVVFIAGTMCLGFLWAWLLERRDRAEGLFRTVYLFPMAVSSVAAGVVWKWLLNPNEGTRASGLNRLFQIIHLDFLQNGWWNDNSVGIAAIALAAMWQLSGYVMALFLAGFRGISDDMREAARVDGATEWQLYRHVLFPQLSPVALSALIIIGHMSLKAFDLIVSISKPANYQTKVPAIDMYLFKSEYNYANAAAVGVILLLFVLVLIVPYLVRMNRSEK